LPAGTVNDKAGNSSLIVTIPYSVIEDTEDPEDPAAYQEKWPGLGMDLFCGDKTDLNTIIGYGFTELRIDIPDYDNYSWVKSSKNAVTIAVSKGANVVWGVKPGGTITASNWSDFRTACIDAAQWAQDNGVFEFQLGNEGEYYVDGVTLTLSQYITNLKSLATEVQAIFTNGNVSYSCFHENIDDWVSAGKGDIDLLASNVYRAWGAGNNPIPWEDEINTLISAFGTDGTYLTEFSLNTSGIGYWSEDETVQAIDLTEMIDYIKATGIERAFFFSWKDNQSAQFGAVKIDGTYRLLWEQALLSTVTVRFATVPTTTTTVSLPETIAFLPRTTE
jgi:hypothetical protein